MSGMDRNTQGFDVHVNEDILSVSPHCEHGPTLLFEKYCQKHEVKRYFACSAYRDRKHCHFYKPWTERLFKQLNSTKHTCVNQQTDVDQEKDQENKKFSRLQNVMQTKVTDRRYCHLCDVLLVKSDTAAHRGHRVTAGISDSLMKQPSKLLVARDDNKSQAQYLFSEDTVDFLVKTIKHLKFDRVVCIGVPRLHETLLMKKHQLKVDSLLLDIDERFAQFFKSSEFCRYNMFNHHFFDKSSIATVQSFLRQCDRHKVLVVMDPPFGGLVGALVFTMSQISKLSTVGSSGTNSKEILPLMWIFPYFMEKRIISALPSFRMLDYKVSYDNHLLFRNGSKSKKNSPVRIFTNISPDRIPLPAEDGYWHCSKCQRFSAPENHHCDKCNTCPSKDGSTYRHCTRCNRCVKPVYTHCAKCKRCELPSHNCERVLAGCHLCGDSSHKRRECPQRKTLELRYHSLEDQLQIFTNKVQESSTEEEIQLHNGLEINKRERSRTFEFRVRCRWWSRDRTLRKPSSKKQKERINSYVKRRRLKKLRSTIYNGAPD